jgi:hypothetical protein
MRFYFLYILRRILKGYPYDIPTSKENRVVFPLHYSHNFFFAARMNDSHFDETKVSRVILQQLFIDLYVSIENFMVLWLHVFAMVIPIMFSLKFLKALYHLTESTLWVLYIPIWLVFMEVCFSLLMANGMKMMRLKIEKFFESKRDLFEGLNINFLVPPQHCLWIVLIMNDDGSTIKDAEERGKLFDDEEREEKEDKEEEKQDADEPDTTIEV